MKRILTMAALLLTLSQGIMAHEGTDSQTTEVPYCRWAPSGYWQPRKVWPAEVEIYFGGTIPFRVPKNHTRSGGINLGLEYRYNLPDLPIAIGGVANAYSVTYDDTPTRIATPPEWPLGNAYGANMALYQHGTTNVSYYHGYFDPYCSTQSVGGGFFGPLVEYSLARGAAVSPFVSVATGLWLGGPHNNVFIRPKVGVELGRWVRFSASTLYAGTNTFSFSATLGLVIGGWQRSW